MSVQLPSTETFIGLYQFKLRGYIFRTEFWSSSGRYITQKNKNYNLNFILWLDWCFSASFKTHVDYLWDLADNGLNVENILRLHYYVTECNYFKTHR
jgi:hypothetical protein